MGYVGVVGARMRNGEEEEVNRAEMKRAEIDRIGCKRTSIDFILEGPKTQKPAEESPPRKEKKKAFILHGGAFIKHGHLLFRRDKEERERIGIS